MTIYIYIYVNMCYLFCVTCHGSYLIIYNLQQTNLTGPCPMVYYLFTTNLSVSPLSHGVLSFYQEFVCFAPVLWCIIFLPRIYLFRPCPMVYYLFTKNLSVSPLSYGVLSFYQEFICFAPVPLCIIFLPRICLFRPCPMVYYLFTNYLSVSPLYQFTPDYLIKQRPEREYNF
jgi:hypothetical protein